MKSTSLVNHLSEVGFIKETPIPQRPSAYLEKAILGLNNPEDTGMTNR